MTRSASARVTLYVCTTCRRNGEPLEPRDHRSGVRLKRALAAEIARRVDAIAIDLVPVECLSGCKHGCTIAVSAPGKWTFVVGDLDPACHVGDVITFAAQHAAHSEGLPLWRERPEVVRKGVLARVPSLMTNNKEPADER